ncbi:MAG: DoxX family membrane protein [Acidobacteriota bacterium]
MQTATSLQRRLATSGVFLLAAWAALPALAHVKWFTDFSYLTPPLEVHEVATPLYFGLVVLSMLVIAGLVLVEQQLEGLERVKQLNEWLVSRRRNSVTVMRLAMAAVLLINWSSDAVLAPELKSSLPLLVWLQFIVALLLFFSRTFPVGGAGLLLIYLGSVFEFGLFHMLDYLHFLGIGLFLLVRQFEDVKIRGLGLPALYATIGFSLIWLAYEKLFYPSWALYLLEQNPQLALGFPPEFFLQGAAFIEISLGFLLLLGLLERPLAAFITMVFFGTTLIFGKVEVIGHTPIHAALIVFLLSGTDGTIYKPPIALAKTLPWRIIFSVASFAAVVTVFLFAYSWTAHRQFDQAYEDALTQRHGVHVFNLSDQEAVPEFRLIEVVEETPGSYDLHVRIDNWTFTPEKTGQASVANEGHGHIFVNGIKVGRLYSEWFHLGELEPGQYQIIITLNGNDHSDFMVDGRLVQGERIVTLTKTGSTESQHQNIPH